MPNIPAQMPLALYIHIPWCVRKCPYCDFNSHAQKGDLPEKEYIAALLDELDERMHLIKDREIISIFFGGGTPSLFSPQGIEQILTVINERIALSRDIEITLEANPGTVDSKNFAGFREAGINRLSLGIQSFEDDKLRALGRIHDSDCAKNAIEIARTAGFSRFNIDLMYGLPQQTVAEALADLKTALSYQPPHLSWYQLTLEANTLFAHQPPLLPDDDLIWEMQTQGQTLLQQENLQQYEVSAYAREGEACQHNLNYWQFGDYLGLGAGAHSKITDQAKNEIIRFSQVRHPRDYLLKEKRLQLEKKIIAENDIIFEFMLNALRLTEGFPLRLFSERTGLKPTKIENLLGEANARGFLQKHERAFSDQDCYICPSPLGKRFLNQLMMMFLP